MSDDLVKRLREDYRENYEESIPYEVIETYKKERHEAADRIEQLEDLMVCQGRYSIKLMEYAAELEEALSFYYCDCGDGRCEAEIHGGMTCGLKARKVLEGKDER